ncbi:two-component sensor histidine kinase, partial [Rhizobium ruizarguesonis]
PMTKAERLHFLDNIVADAVRLDALLQRLRDLAQAESSVADGSSSVADTISSLRERFPALNTSSRGDTEISTALPPTAAGIAFTNL